MPSTVAFGCEPWIYTTALKSIPSTSDLPFHTDLQGFGWDWHKCEVEDSCGFCLPYIPSF